MPDLIIDNIEKISRDIRRQEITFSHLFDDLLDHICCDVEMEMVHGLSFSEAYARVKEKLGGRRLKEIQEETLYAVDTKYRKMKNTMKISGIAGTVMLGFGALFRITNLPGAGIILTLGAVILALVLLPSALVVLWKETRSGKRLFLFFAAFLTGASFILGVLFKVQHWPGAGAVITLSVLAGVVFLIPSLLLQKLRENGSRKKIPVYITGSVAAGIYLAGFLFRIMHWPLAGLLFNLSSFLLFFVVFPWYAWLTWKNETHVSAKFIFMVIACMSLLIMSALLNIRMEKAFEEGEPSRQENLESFHKQQGEKKVHALSRKTSCWQTQQFQLQMTKPMNSIKSGAK